MERRKLSDSEIAERLTPLPRWQYENERIRREFASGNFVAGINLVIRIGAVAEELNHHPDIQLTYAKLVVGIYTHDVGGITDFDFALAQRIDELADLTV